MCIVHEYNMLTCIETYKNTKSYFYQNLYKNYPIHEKVQNENINKLFTRIPFIHVPPKVLFLLDHRILFAFWMRLHTLLHDKTQMNHEIF